MADTEKVKHRNFRSVLSCVALRALTENRSEDGFPVVAELFFEENRPYFERAGVDKLVSLRTVGARLMSNAVLNPGISELVTGLLHFDSRQVARLVSVGEVRELLSEERSPAGLPFREAVLQARRAGWHLLSLIQSERMERGPSVETEFREESPYAFRGTGKDGLDAVIGENDFFVAVIPNRYGRNSPPRLLGPRGEAPFSASDELVLLVGNGSVGAEIAEALLPRCRGVIRILHPLPPPDGTLTDSRDAEPPNIERNGKLTTVELRGALDENFLRRNAEHFAGVSRVVVLGPDRSVVRSSNAITEDDETLVLALLLKRLSREVFGRPEEAHVVAELRAVENLRLFHEAGVDQPVPAALLAEEILVQMLFHRGWVSEFFLKAMSYRETNRRGRLMRVGVSLLEAEIGAPIVGKSFDDLVSLLLANGWALLAVQRAGAVEGSERFVINPAPSADDRVRGDDFLFVLGPTDYCGG